MACIRKRRGTWVVDYRDSAGVRRCVTCETRRAAEAILAEKLRESRQPSRPAVDVNITLADYAAQWRHVIEASIKPRTQASYEQILRVHIIPAFGAVNLRVGPKLGAHHPRDPPGDAQRGRGRRADPR